jgi:hypothetical protein
MRNGLMMVYIVPAGFVGILQPRPSCFRFLSRGIIVLITADHDAGRDRHPDDGHHQECDHAGRFRVEAIRWFDRTAAIIDAGRGLTIS